MIFFFFFNDTPTTEIYTLSLHDALPILTVVAGRAVGLHFAPNRAPVPAEDAGDRGRGQAALAEQAQRVSFGEGDLAVRHGRLLSLGGEQKTTVCQVTFLFGDPVALTI